MEIPQIRALRAALRPSTCLGQLYITLLVLFVVKYLFARRAKVLAVCFVSLSRPSQGPYRKVRHQDESMPILSSVLSLADHMAAPEGSMLRLCHVRSEQQTVRGEGDRHTAGL